MAQNLKLNPIVEIAPGRNIGGNWPCFIIAEIGQNHQGDVKIAKQLIKIAKESGVDCVKFQKSCLKNRFTKEVLKRPYQSKNSWGKTYGEHRENLELSEKEFKGLKEYADELEIYFTASGMDQPSMDFLENLGVPFFKIGSADTTNLPLLRHVSKYQKPLVISTGITNEVDLCKMYNEISKVNKSIVLLQCTSSYPTLPCNVNLNVIRTYCELFPFSVIGYSGHEVGTDISLAAVAAGAKVLERHITINHSLKGSDHISSLNPEELNQLVCKIRTIEEAMGSLNKKIQDCESPCFDKLGKTIVTSRFLKQGTTLLANMMDVKVAVKKGFDAIHFDDLIGKKIKRDLEEEDTILPNDVV